MKLSHWLLCVLTNCDWSRKITPLSNLARAAKAELPNLQILKKMLEKLSQFLSSEQPCEPKSLDVALNISEAPASGAHTHMGKKTKPINEFFSWLSCLAVLLVGAYARPPHDDSDGVAQDGGHNSNNSLTETYSETAALVYCVLL